MTFWNRKEKSNSQQFLDKLEGFFEQEGKAEYLGETLSIAEHMLQSAYVAQRANAEKNLIAATLLHDIGYFARVRNVVIDQHKTHDEAGAAFLQPYFPLEVTEPVRLHVKAKRYLVARDTSYMQNLSEASIYTLNLQGGPMNKQEMHEFEANSHHKNALMVREWDDSGKNKDSRRILNFQQFRPLLQSVMSFSQQ